MSEPRPTNHQPQPLGSGEQRREAKRVREMRDWEMAVNKGYRNKAIEERLKKHD